MVYLSVLSIEEFYLVDENMLIVRSHFLYTLIDKMCLIIKTNLLKSHALFNTDQVALRSISQTFSNCFCANCLLPKSLNIENSCCADNL